MQLQKTILSKPVPMIGMLGGSLLAIHYVLHLAYGFQTGKILWDDMSSPLGVIDGSLFTAAFATIDLTLIALAMAYYRQLNGLKYGVLFFGIVAFLAAITGFVAVTFWHMIPYVMPIACLAMFISAILLSIACLKPRLLPTWVRFGLMAFGLCTAPLGFALPKVLATLPMYATFEMHFLPSGLLWVAMGIAMSLQRRKQLQAIKEYYAPAYQEPATRVSQS
ncbi:hypothetical protein [Rufibacter hautae]|uniref:DUF998 domain-containing protein n=1 Tax=Rufibacter hautae TaxID=2595005 RepID=A0A5B6TC22_9BACT|nr:hypothetical protein [Rufibacter hautae]KAA3438019.1 hypothetical protein FOA19_12140 [Rufibacter hautae]